MAQTVSKKTIIVFSGDFDRAMAAFIIANGAAAMGDEVTMFFTFWGLTVLRRPEKVKGGTKSALQTMFSSMLPRGPGRLGMSRMNFCGIGPMLMKKAMKQENAMSLEKLIETAREQGVKLTVCTMSMGILGLKEEELIDGLEYVGVGSYLGAADDANMNLFI